MNPVDQTPGAAARPRRAWWPPAAVATASALIAGAGLLASTDLQGIPAIHATPGGHPSATAPRVELTLADEDGTGREAAPALQALQGAPRGSPESRLIDVYRLLAAGRTQDALDAASALTRDVPTFRLAQLLYADLLLARAGDPARVAAVTQAVGTAPPGELAELRNEAMLRLRALQERPPLDQVPAEFILLPKAVHHAIAVDTSRSRLYLFQNTAQGLRLVSDHYISVGKQGVDKAVEGDQRTPLGVYFVSDRMGGGSLEKRFGAGALQLNYPNAFDKLRGRTGGGIYVHGVPENTYSRPPRDSDGCVVMANDELVALMNSIPVHDTPVVITRHLHWMADDASQASRAGILDAVNRWQSVRASGDTRALDAFYEAGARPAPPGASAASAPLPAPEPRRAVASARRPAPAASDPLQFNELSVLTWQDERETMVVTFHERTARNHETVLRQYWERRPDHRWTIVAEGTVR